MDSVYKLVLHQNNSKLPLFLIGIIILLFLSWPLCIVILLLLIWTYISGIAHANKYIKVAKNDLVAKKNLIINVTVFEQQAMSMLSGNRSVAILKKPYTIDTIAALSENKMVVFLYKLEYGILFTYIPPLYIKKTDGIYKENYNNIHLKPDEESKSINIKFQKLYHNIERLNIQFVEKKNTSILFHEESVWNIQ